MRGKKKRGKILLLRRFFIFSLAHGDLFSSSPLLPALFVPPLFKKKKKKKPATSNLLNDEDPQNFRHIVAPRGEDGRPLLEWVTPEAVFLPLEELVAVALADDAERCRPGAPPPPPPSPSSPSSSSSPYPCAADPLDVVLVAHKILMKTLVEDTEDPTAAAARPCPCSKTITVVVAGEEEHGEAYERGRGGVDAGLTGDAAVLLEGLGCKLRVLLVDPSPELRARGGGASAAKKEEERDDKVKVDDDDGGGGGDSDEDGDLSPPPKQLKLPAALEALVDALPRGRGLVRIQRVAGAVGLSGALVEAPPPATTSSPRSASPPSGAPTWPPCYAGWPSATSSWRACRRPTAFGRRPSTQSPRTSRPCPCWRTRRPARRMRSR